MFKKPFPNAMGHLPPHLLALWPMRLLLEVFIHASGSILLVGGNPSTVLVKASCLAY